MTPLFADGRRGLLILLLAVALTELGAAIVIAESLHRGPSRASLILLAAATLSAFGLQILQRRLSEGVGLSYAAAVRKALFSHLMAADSKLVRRRRHGAMLQSFVGDLTSLRQWVSDGIVRGVLAVVALAGMLGWLASSDARLVGLLGAIAAVAILVGAACLSPLSRAVADVRRERGRVAAFASERLAAQATVQACGRIASETGRLERRVERLNAASLRRAWFTGTLRALPHLAATAMLAAVVLSHNAGSVGSLAGGLVVVGILGLALRDLARAGELMIPGRIATARIESLLALPTAIGADSDSERMKGEAGLVLADLQLRSRGQTLSAWVSEGSVILIEGHQALRRTFFAVLSGLEPPHSGSVRWNGRRITALAPSRRSKLVGSFGPELRPVAGSAGLNIRYRAPHLPEKKVRALAEHWSLDPKDRQSDPLRVSLARAMAGKPPILALDLSEASLSRADIERLRGDLAQWGGVVLLSTDQPALREAATEIWRLSGRGLQRQQSANSGADAAGREVA